MSKLRSNPSLPVGVVYVLIVPAAATRLTVTCSSSINVAQQQQRLGSNPYCQWKYSYVSSIYLQC